jgi:transglutaminase-like putative cysteine protease
VNPATRNPPETAVHVLSNLLPLLGERDRRLLAAQRFLDRGTQPQLYGEPTPAQAPFPAGSRPRLEEAARRLAGEARPGLATAVALTTAVFRLAERASDGSDRDDDTVLDSGQATPLERARLLAALCRVARLAARLCLLYRDQEPGFHAVCEVQIMGRWSLFDPFANQFFHLSHLGYASAWDVMRRPAIVDAHPEHGRKSTIDSSFYHTVAVADLPPGS